MPGFWPVRMLLESVGNVFIVFTLAEIQLATLYLNVNSPPILHIQRCSCCPIYCDAEGSPAKTVQEVACHYSRPLQHGLMAFHGLH